MRNHCQRLLLLVALSCITANSALGAAGYVGAYFDSGGATCDFSVPANATVTVYIVHKLLTPGDGAQVVRFSVIPPAGWTYLSFVSPWLNIGYLATDMSIGYGVCRTTQTLIGTSSWSVGSSSPTCGQLRIGPSIYYSTVVGSDCAFHDIIIGAHTSFINPTPGCCCDCVPTEPRTWGSVKALYH